MFNLLKFSVDKVSGLTEVRVMVQNNPDQESKLDGGSFSSEANAQRWLSQLKKDYFLFKIEKFIAHKANIIEAGEGRHSAVKLNSLKRCYDFLKWACDPPPAFIREICSNALKIRTEFENILPHEKNKSYESSRKNLTEMMIFCKDQVSQTTDNVRG